MPEDNFRPLSDSIGDDKASLELWEDFKSAERVEELGPCCLFMLGYKGRVRFTNGSEVRHYWIDICPACGRLLSPFRKKYE